MASNVGYNNATTPVVSFFSKEQRARLEALTYATKLYVHDTYRENIAVADYIIKGN